MRFGDAPATFGIALVTLVVSGMIASGDLLGWFAMAGGFIPARIEGVVLPPALAVHAVPAWLTPLSATLIHGGWLHLGFNLLMLCYCGAQAERVVSSWGIAILYLVGAYAAAAGHWLFEPGSTMPMIGASGAISAVVGAYALLFGRRQVKAIGPLPARIVHVVWLAAAWVGLQLLIGLAGFGSAPIAVGAHIGGFLVGLALARPLLLWRFRDA